MSSGLRPLALQESSSGDSKRAAHVVGIDESGNSADGAFVLAAVQCPRSSGERLAELLIELDLDPWVSKSSSAPSTLTDSGLTDTVIELIRQIRDEPITWHAAACWGNCPVDKQAMTACIISTKSLTRHRDSQGGYEGNAALLHDGKGDNFGNGYIKLRRAGRTQFEGFGDRETPVFISMLESGDRIYPEITAADYIAGLIRSEIHNEGSIEAVDIPMIDRISNSWSTPKDASPEPQYEIRARNHQREPKRQDRAAAWIEGRRPPTTDAWGDRPLEAIVDRLSSDVVRNYLLTEL
ncbi:hypothetical protein J2751_002441 [Halorubrum alkaliphilum]|uniref:DUF3800 domain-containing protein n=1 Tax=Halorubrum alkaliphilum TaxID=261290 RepID=A0A8T4GI38_9EURY|nr:hypothetical protein [Halorubrum alkaliphilum]MBP1923399.1 hypothetical protein [Halorubrum alkaliphilum]